MKTLTSLVTLALLTLIASTAMAQDNTIRRFALVVGANDGGDGRPVLRYANSDAESVSRVLEEFANVEPDDQMLVLQPDVPTFEQAMGQMAARLQEARDGSRRTEVIFYYSGHSDESGLLLGSERMPYKKLKLYIQSLPADVRLAVLDSCSSGAFTLTKGGDRKKAFLIDDSNKVEGYAFLTSSSADESAQESERMGGSFFTHYFLTGLRGAADATGDQRVTLNEAYEFAFKETLQRTETTAAGAQHANYDIQLTGSGDLVLTDLRGTSARLQLGARVHGRFFIRDADGRLVAELFKADGRVVELGLDPGTYEVVIDDKGDLRRGLAEVDSSGVTRMGHKDFVAVVAEATATRGGPIVATPDPGDYEVIPFDLGLFPGVQLSGTHAGKTEHQLQLNLFVGATDRVRGGQGAIIGNIADESVVGVQASSVFNVAGGDVTGGQYASAVNVVGGQLDGLQISGAANIAGGDVNFGQITGGANIADGNIWGAQVAGGANIADGNVHGAQVAAGANISGGLVNGVQVAAGVNVADAIDGTQVAPINIGGDVSGAQFGVINIGGKVDGGMVGIINIAGELNGPPIGLLNFIGNGQFHLEAFADDITPANAAVRFGSEHFYTILGGGASLDDQELFHFFGGLGAHIPIGPVFFDVDVVSGQLHRSRFTARTNTLSRARLAFGWQIFDHLAVFGGTSLNVWVADAAGREDFQVGPEVPEDAVGTTLSVWPGFFAGVQF